MIARRNSLLLAAFRFFSSLIPAYVIERLYWEQRGMTVQLVVYTEIIYAVVIVLSEVPTGLLADRWSRKRLIVISGIAGCLEFLLLLGAHSFWHFAAVVSLAGLGRSAASGAENALLYDSLQAGGRESGFERVLGRLNAVDLTAAVLAALCGGLLAGRFGLELNYWLSAGSAACALAFALLLVEPGVPGRGQEEERGPNVREAIVSALRFFRSHPGVSLVVLAGMVTGAALGFIYEFWQLYLNRTGIPVMYFGLFSAAFMLLGMPGSLLAAALRRRYGYRPVLLSVTGVYAAGFIVVSVVQGYAGLAAMLAIGLASGLVVPLVSGYLHHRIDSAMRATMDSFQSLGENVMLIAAGLGFGWFSTGHDIFGGYGFLAAVCTAFFLIFALASRRLVEA